jgi:long-chain acyl-CoA synthetase
VAADEGLLVISTAAVDVVPRGAVLTHANLLTSNTLTAHAFGLSEQDGNLLALPLYHIAALGTALAVMQVGGVNALMPRYDAAEAVNLIDEHKLTVVSSFPPVLSALLDAAGEAGSKLASLKHVTGLEGPDVIGRLEKETSARFWIGFGQSETTGFVSLQPASEKPGAAGRPLPLCQITLVDDQENEVPVGTAGEILVRGPLVMKEYFAQPEVTAQTFRGGWHHTGDLGKFDEGYLYYAGRKPEKELIKPGGENVYPAEVEAAIMEMDGVRGVCVFGVPDEQWGEAIRAVVEAEGKDAAEVIDHVGSRIARYKRPKTVEFTSELPRGKSGEVDREAVKAKWGESA